MLLQIIVAVSELINDIVGLSNSRAFADSLSIINSYAHNDKAMQVSVICLCLSKKVNAFF